MINISDELSSDVESTRVVPRKENGVQHIII